MGRGGARAGAGRPVDPNSERSEKRRRKGETVGRRFGRLPRAGFTGRVPAWPLTSPATARERAVWKALWRTPQAAAWATEPWRHRAVANYARLAVRCEDPEASAALFAAEARLADRIGLTPNGLLANKWEIEEAPGSRALAEGEGEPVPSGKPAAQPPEPGVPLRDRLKVVGDVVGGG